ncbi:peroxiredoxin [Candidatus Wolfebacteria bacterium]|nr:MAG: peroxiredoxin [Candidatus Wolfebacteria bacterium]
MMKIGDSLPEIKMKAFFQDNEVDFNTSDYKGKWLILFFYPADFTFVCPTELEELADMYDEFTKEGAEIVSVSTDTVFVHKAWHDTSKAVGKITFPMVADPTGSLSRLFGTYIEEEGLSLRGSFIIDPDGILRAMEINDNSIGRNAKELLRKLQAAKFIKEHEGTVCPAGWKPGDEPLHPGMDLVGKI